MANYVFQRIRRITHCLFGALQNTWWMHTPLLRSLIWNVSTFEASIYAQTERINWWLHVWPEPEPVMWAPLGIANSVSTANASEVFENTWWVHCASLRSPLWHLPTSNASSVYAALIYRIIGLGFQPNLPKPLAKWFHLWMKTADVLHRTETQ